jgi:hypothetical protein
VPLVENDDVVEALATDGSDHTLTLPRGGQLAAWGVGNIIEIPIAGRSLPWLSSTPV